MSSGGDGGCSFGCFPFYFIAARLSRCLVACWRLKFYGILLCLKDLNVFVSDSLFCFPPGFRYSRQLFIESALGGYLFWKDVCISFLDFNTDIFLRLSHFSRILLRWDKDYLLHGKAIVLPWLWNPRSGDTFREDNKKEMTMKRMTENVASGIGIIKFGLSRLSHFRLRTILRVKMKTRTTTTEIPKRNTPDQIEWRNSSLDSQFSIRCFQIKIWNGKIFRIEFN